MVQWYFSLQYSLALVFTQMGNNRDLTQRLQYIHRRSPGKIKYWHDFTTTWAYYIFTVPTKNICSDSLKYSGFGSSADVKPIQSPGSAWLLSPCTCCNLYGIQGRRFSGVCITKGGKKNIGKTLGQNVAEVPQILLLAPELFNPLFLLSLAWFSILVNIELSMV